jgi:hypothetical protein
VLGAVFDIAGPILSFSAAARAKVREAEGTAMAAVMSFMKVLLFIARALGGRLGPRG